MAFKTFTTAELLATIVKPGDSLCEALKKVNASYRLAYQYARYKYKNDGSLSEAYCAELRACAALAANSTTNTTTT